MGWEIGLRRVLWAAVWLWLIALAGLLALFELIGENAWPVVLLLYLPRFLWIIPGLVLLPFALRWGRRALLFPLAIGALFWLFALAGFVLPRPSPVADGPKLRVLSYNTAHSVDGVEGLRALILQTKPDLVLFQWSSHHVFEAMSGAGFEGWTVRRVAQFTVASRFRILSVEPGGIPWRGEPPMAHAVVETPLGTLDVFDIRPHSARDEVGATRHRGLRTRFRELVANARAGRMTELAGTREAQVRSIADEAARAQHLVLIAGDTNLPDGSLLFRRYFGSYKDAFVESGWGFGYTHPSKLPWMRLDKVLLGPGLVAGSFEVLSRHVSSHKPVLVDIARASSH
jgi:endonuclease/exonuclease/phosphatase (EEP) superfamily protein YafD